MVERVRCPSCDEPNDVERTYCRRCGSPLGAAPVRFRPAAGDDEDLGELRARRGVAGQSRGGWARLGGNRARVLWIVAASATGVALVGGLLANADWFAGSEPLQDVSLPPTARPDPTPALDSPSATPVTPSRLDRGDVTASATSTLEPDGAIRYDADVTLDGDPATAWNDGVEDDVGIGERLTYRFAEPVLLDALEVVNGYDKVLESGEDVWRANARVKDLTVSTDTASVTATLRDDRDLQVVSVRDRGTCSVVLTIDSVHPGSSYSDVAISEVEFLGSLAGGTCE